MLTPTQRWVIYGSMVVVFVVGAVATVVTDSVMFVVLACALIYGLTMLGLWMMDGNEKRKRARDVSHEGL